LLRINEALNENNKLKEKLAEKKK